MLIFTTTSTVLCVPPRTMSTVRWRVKKNDLFFFFDREYTTYYRAAPPAPVHKTMAGPNQGRCSELPPSVLVRFYRSKNGHRVERCRELFRSESR